MSKSTPPVSATFIWAIALMFCVLVAAVVALAIGLPESANPAGLVAQLLMAFAALVGVLANLWKSVKIEASLDEVKTDTGAIRNGEMEGKLHSVLDERELREKRPGGPPPTMLQA